MRIGVDLGGTKIEAIALGAGGTILARHRVPTPVGDYAGTLDAVAGLVGTIEQQLGCRGSVGIGTPGAISSRTGLIKNSNSTVLIGKRLDQDLAAKLERPVRLANDANCFALSEAADGAGAGANVVFGVILGTGVGGGVVVERKILVGRNDIAGEWGHNPLPWPRPDELPGVPCYCGKAGCIETFLSGPGLARTYQTAAGKILTAEAVARAAAAGEPQAVACLDLYADRLARALTAVINILDPDVIVLGGGLSNIAPLYEELPPRIASYAFSDAIDTPIVPARHGDSSGVRGAAWLWPQG
ncbi:MAG: ROK family protein [Xanthobacteraceae bacterium]|nr:ROK family protein [Xanthobacteraceae bacterium]